MYVVDSSAWLNVQSVYFSTFKSHYNGFSIEFSVDCHVSNGFPIKEIYYSARKADNAFEQVHNPNKKVFTGLYVFVGAIQAKL